VVGLFGTSSIPSEQYHRVGSNLLIIIIIIIFLHGLGRLTCSGIDALPSFSGASSRFVVEGMFWKSGVVHSFNVQGRVSLLMSTLIFLGRVTSHPQNPHSWRTSLSFLVWLLSYYLLICGLLGDALNQLHFITSNRRAINKQ
jgi:hypothetical protein